VTRHGLNWNEGPWLAGSLALLLAQDSGAVAAVRCGTLLPLRLYGRHEKAATMTEEILLLDDDLTSLTVLEAALGAAGFKCSICSDPQQALILVANRPEIAVVVTDLYMPHMSGLQFADALAALELGRPAPRVLLLTARPSLESAVGALRRGAYDFLVKPVSQAEIADAVSRALERARADRLIQASAAPDVEKLVQRAEELAGELRRLAQPGQAPQVKPNIAAELAREAAPAPPTRTPVSVLDTIEQLRRLRSRYEDHRLDDVGWELLLELLRAEQHEQRLSVSALTISIPGVSATTSLRRIGELASRGYVDRVPDERDGRRDFVSLTSKSRVLLKDYLAQVDSFLMQLRSNSKQSQSPARPPG
jgi:FixJ family two-component response regulator/DNA-binding MarR family transcriptional regulator